ncbi:MAG: hypothetical protein IIY16_01890 [Oscillospiraceae bacterium]|nr:hypothetical protein [Oscillospiraceae bacterium]
MRIKHMHAVFGRLDHAELELGEGLNILELPNESGKSTWCAFLLAMFYGIDTAERAAKGVLPAKTKYKPWSGAAMEGRIELEWNGRDITIERTSKGRIPLGEFRAYETASGLPVRELTAANCGSTLLGVEKGVFERSAFLRQSGLAVSQDSALERRLGALVSSGEETVSYIATEQRLRDRRNACRHNQTGELPRTEALLASAEDKLAQIRRQQAELVSLRAEEEQLTAAITQSETILRGLRAAENRKKREMLEQVKAQSLALAAAADTAAQTAASLPDEETLIAWRQTWAQLQAERRALPVDAVQLPQQPEVPAVFAGKQPDEIRAEAAAAVRDHETYAAAAVPQKQPMPWLAICAAVIAAVLAAIGYLLYAIAPLALGACALGLWMRSRNADRREAETAAFEAEQLLRRYDADSPQALLQKAEHTAARLERWHADLAQAEAEQTKRREQAESLLQREQAWLEKWDIALGNCSSDPAAAFEAALACRRTAERARQEADRAALQYAALEKTMPAEDTEAPAPEVSPERYNASDIAAKKAAAEQRLGDVRHRLAVGLGHIGALGDPAELESVREQAEERIARLRRQHRALTLAMDTLAAANDALQTRFAPQISRRAAEIMHTLTDGRYEQVLLDRTLAIEARETGAVAAHALPTLSQGTADQLYLAVRLSICDAVLPADAPVVLDDALANFDDARAACAVKLLAQLGADRQILLFTCQSRENMILNS